jgi:hypothetical protein
MHTNFELKRFDTIYEESEEGSIHGSQEYFSGRGGQDTLFPNLQKQSSTPRGGPD